MRLLFKIISDGIRKAYDSMCNGKEYRQYQVDTLKNLQQIRAEVGKRALVKIATGGGKTTIASMDVMLFSKEFEKTHGRKPNILWIAHRDELLEQADRDISEKIDSYSNEADEERELEVIAELQRDEQSTGETLAVCRDVNAYKEGILVSSIQKLTYGNNLETFEAGFDYIVIDEAHHAYADSYMRVINKYQDAFIVGLTATPQRFSDRRNVADLFERTAMDKNIVDMVNEGHLSTMYFHKVETSITPIGAIEEDTELTKDYQLSKYWKMLGSEGQKKRDQLVVETYLKLQRQEGHYSDRRLGKGDIDLEHKAKAPAVTFAMNFEHARALTELYKASGVKAEMISSKGMSKQQRRDVIKRFRAGEFQMLVSIDILNEGVDLPAIEVGLMARPTRSKTIYMQQIGRLARKCSETGKKSALIIDFVDNMGEYQRPLSSTDIFKTRDSVETDTHGDNEEETDTNILDGEIVIEDIVNVDMEEIFGGYPPLDIARGERGITGNDSSIFDNFIGVSWKLAGELNSRLDKEWAAKTDKTKNELIYKDLKFYKRRNNNNQIWATDKENASEVARILGKKWYSFKLAEFNPVQGERGVIGAENSIFENFIEGKESLAKELNSRLDEEWEAKTDKTKDELIYEGVKFYIRAVCGKTIWVTNEENASAIARILYKEWYSFKIEELNLAKGEIGVTGQRENGIFENIVGKNGELAKELNSRLDEEWEAKAEKTTNELVYEGVRFYKRRNGPITIWATDKENASEVARILGKKWYSFKLEAFDPAKGEQGLTQGENSIFENIVGTKKELAKELSSRLDEEWEVKVEKTMNELVYEGVRFYKRMSGSKTIWATDKSNATTVARILGKEYYAFKIEAFDPEKGERGFLLEPNIFENIEGFKKELAKDLNRILDKEWESKVDKTINELIYKGVRFNKKQARNGNIIWVTDRSNASAVAGILGKEWYPFKIEAYNPENGERAVVVKAENSIFEGISGKESLAKELNSRLDEEWKAKTDKTKNELIYYGLKFYKRDPGKGKIIWVTDKNNASAVAKILGKELKD